MIFKRLRWKLTVSYIAVVILSMLILGTYLLNSLENYFYQNLEKRLTSQALLASKLVAEEIGILDANGLEQLAGQISEDVQARATIINSRGLVLGDSERDPTSMENHLNRPEIQAAGQKGSGTAIRHSKTLNTDMMYVAVPIKAHGTEDGYMRLALPLTEIKHAFFGLWSDVLKAILIAMLIAIPVGLTLGKKITGPVEQLIDFARQIARGNYDGRVRIRSSDEIGKLAMTLDEMADTIKEKVRLISEGKNKLEAVLANMSSGVIFIDKLGRVDLVNPAAEKFLAFLIKRGADIPHGSSIRYPELSSAINDALQKGQVIEQEVKIFIPEEAILEVIVSPFRDQSGALNGVVAVLHDISQIRKLEKIRTEFVDNVSHELKTPVTAIKGFTETLLDGAMYQEDTCREFIEIIDNEAARLSRLVHDLLDLSKIESKHAQIKTNPVDINEIVRDTAAKLHGQIDSSGLELKLALPGQPVVAEVNSDMIDQVLINLIDNAIKYTYAGGRIEVEVSEDDRNIVVRVRDNGIGIPAADLDRIFERFYRVDKTRSRAMGGTGLGLSIVKHIVDLHGGTVGVHSTPGVGSEFYFTLLKNAR
ncbi:two-component system, OmpR family, phosphate regulon sensor histidine kinase PhoR [Desulfotomaculum arcticum]|uniref:histidine kinase n=1 Tax=Desulfotruncus arcticus DSM 17038 TaxID=1121424 RepID=A0A1I2UY21_9FIRM|nr:ATP-binding protein [Desulfotruncus arcticus]SFG82075.1 two-component system, OmpR family, phosphate regulon sensor histidine kinase PhoR [Desulfotomaculum arcticum] [Desulfotruncus arcticus DSM 17038]